MADEPGGWPAGRPGTTAGEAEFSAYAAQLATRGVQYVNLPADDTQPVQSGRDHHTEPQASETYWGQMEYDTLTIPEGYFEGEHLVAYMHRLACGAQNLPRTNTRTLYRSLRSLPVRPKIGTTDTLICICWPLSLRRAAGRRQFQTPDRSLVDY